jgi:hypothetical protein
MGCPRLRRRGPCRQWGANGPTLTTSGVAASEAGQYDFVICNRCDTAATIATSLSVPDPCCDSIDCSEGTSLLEPTDIIAFLSVFGEGPRMVCGQCT